MKRTFEIFTTIPALPTWGIFLLHLPHLSLLLVPTHFTPPSTRYWVWKGRIEKQTNFFIILEPRLVCCDLKMVVYLMIALVLSPPPLFFSMTWFQLLCLISIYHAISYPTLLSCRHFKLFGEFERVFLSSPQIILENIDHYWTIPSLHPPLPTFNSFPPHLSQHHPPYPQPGPPASPPPHSKFSPVPPR